MDFKSVNLGVVIGNLEIGLIFLIGHIIGIPITPSGIAIVILLSFLINFIFFLVT